MRRGIVFDEIGLLFFKQLDHGLALFRDEQCVKMPRWFFRLGEAA
jgi:hypothetical protein